MERWNELAAGYVLGNLTDEEQLELSKVLSENPQLKQEITRLRKTATMNRAQASENVVSPISTGAQGWADTAADLPEPSFLSNKVMNSEVVNSKEQDIERQNIEKLNKQGPANSRLGSSAMFSARASTAPGSKVAQNVPQSVTQPVNHSAAQPVTQSNVPTSCGVSVIGGRLLLGEVWQHAKPWGWLVALILVGVGIDNWRVRRLLAIAQERIFQLELSSDYAPSNAD
ncbi:MAG: hypothetical protein AAFQ63_00655 [Cyanobacteria bacterium J06621_11]